MSKFKVVVGVQSSYVLEVEADGHDEAQDIAIERVSEEPSLMKTREEYGTKFFIASVTTDSGSGISFQKLFSPMKALKNGTPKGA